MKGFSNQCGWEDGPLVLLYISLRSEWSLLLRTSQQGLPMLFSGMDNPQKLPLLVGLSTPSNTWFPGPTRLGHPNGISIGSPVLQGTFVWQTNRQTDRATCDIYSNRPHLTHCVHAMRHENNVRNTSMSFVFEVLITVNSEQMRPHLVFIPWLQMRDLHRPGQLSLLPLRNGKWVPAKMQFYLPWCRTLAFFTTDAYETCLR